MAGEVVARHERSLVRHRTLSDPTHAISRRFLREERRELEATAAEPEVELRDLAAYDRLFGVVS